MSGRKRFGFWPAVGAFFLASLLARGAARFLFDEVPSTAATINKEAELRETVRLMNLDLPTKVDEYTEMTGAAVSVDPLTIIYNYRLLVDVPTDGAQVSEKHPHADAKAQRDPSGLQPRRHPQRAPRRWGEHALQLLR